MHVLEVAIRELVSLFPLLALFVIDSQMPFAVLCEAIRANKLVLLLCRGLIFAPRISFVDDDFSFAYEFLA